MERPPDKTDPQGPNAPEADDTLPPFSVAKEALLEATSPALESDPLKDSARGSLSRNALRRVPHRASRPIETGMPRKRENRQPPGQGQTLPLQHPGRQRLHSAPREKKHQSRSQRIDGAGRDNFGGGHEKPVLEEGPTRARGEFPGPGGAYRPRWRAAGREGR